MRTWAALAIVVGACAGEAGRPPDGGAPDGGVDAAPVDPLAGAGAVTPVGGGYRFTEGPQWRAATGDWLWSDIDGDTIYRWTGAGAAASARGRVVQRPR